MRPTNLRLFGTRTRSNLVNSFVLYYINILFQYITMEIRIASPSYYALCELVVYEINIRIQYITIQLRRASHI